MDLAQFVSDFVTMCRESGEPIPPAADIADALADREAPEDATDAQYRAFVKRVTPEIQYLLS